MNPHNPVALLLAADHAAERAGQGEGDHQQQEDLDPVGPRVRILERVRRVHVVEPAAVGAEVLDRFLARHRAAGDRLLSAGNRVDDLVVVVEVLDRAAARSRRSRRRRRWAPECAACHGPGRPRNCPDLRCVCGRIRAPAQSRPPCPTAADTKFCTARPAICTRWLWVDSPEYACQFVFVTKLIAVFQASAGVIGVAGSLRCSGSLPWINWKMNRNRMLIAEKASTLRA